MKLQRRLHFSLLISALLIFSASPLAIAYENKDVANLLGWIEDPNANICHGYFSEPQALIANPTPPPPELSQTKISYAGPGVIHQYGQSVISQKVVVTQPGRIGQADRAIIYRDPKTGKIAYIRLEGNVQVREYGKLITGPYTTIRFDEHTLEAGPTAYHIYNTPYNSWGTADHTFRDASGLVHLSNATYTTCAPTAPSWQMSAERMVLDQKEGFGDAYNMMLRFYNVPVLYVPYYSFPIDNRRKTGFLTPDPSYETKNGWQLAMPYYWNLAPNYDLTTTPRYIQTRGFQLNSQFRFLASPTNHGEVFLGLVPYDAAWQAYRSDTLANPPVPIPGVDQTPYLNDLASSSNSRGYLHLDESNKFNTEWIGHLQLNYVTDDYYFRDFGTAYADVVANQLLNQADVEYQNENYSFTALLQGFQTLHRIDQESFPAYDQYSRLPELDFTSDYANIWHGADFALGAQSVNFAYDSQFSPTTLQLPIGERLHIRPTLSEPLMSSAGYITPQISLDSTSYAAQLAATNSVDTRPQFNASRNLPIADVDSGLYFDRPIHWNNNDYLATLEPRLFYLYVPLMNQDQYPNFDSELLPFTFPQLFDVNRFTSFDRLENANQVSFGITSRVLDSYTSRQTFKFDFGFGYYLQSPQVCLNSIDCDATTYQYISPTAHLTPLVGDITYYPWPHWSAQGSYAYDTSLGETNNASVGVNYNFHQAAVFTLNYSFVREQNGDPTDGFGFSNNTKLISSGVAWPLNEHLSVLTFGQYNISKEREDTIYGGFQYDTCCWTLRAIASRSFSNQYANDENQPVNLFKDAYYVQIQLKSLGNIGNSPTSLLSNTLSGYKDVFK